MRSSSTDRRAPRFLAVAALLLAATLGPHAEATARDDHVVVGVLPSADANVTAELVRGMRFRLDRRPSDATVTVLVGKRGEHWTSVASEAVRLATRERALVLVTPPDRDRAHLLAQVGTRSRVPIVSTAPSPSVTAAGSKWVVSVVPRAATQRDGAPPAPTFAARATDEFESAFRRRFARAPTAWERVGHDAAEVVARALPDGRATRATLMEGLRSGDPIRGATGAFTIDTAGVRRRLPAR